MNAPTNIRPHAGPFHTSTARTDDEAQIRAAKELFRAICRPASTSTAPASSSSNGRAVGDAIRVNRSATAYDLARAAGLDHAAAQDAAVAGLSAIEMLEAGERAQAAAAWSDVVEQLGAQPAAARKHDDDATGNDADGWASVIASLGGQP